jgi:hypothetical protein
MQSVPITTKVVSSNPANGEVYSIEHYVIKFVSDLRDVSGFLHQYNWNIVESGVKHHNPNPIRYKRKYFINSLYIAHFWDCKMFNRLKSFCGIKYYI